jgi:hypothetical protein
MLSLPVDRTSGQPIAGGLEPAAELNALGTCQTLGGAANRKPFYNNYL